MASTDTLSALRGSPLERTDSQINSWVANGRTNQDCLLVRLARRSVDRVALPCHGWAEPIRWAFEKFITRVERLINLVFETTETTIWVLRSQSDF